MSEQDRPQKLGRYEIVRELGKGAMGVVYEGRDPNINRRVAIKTARRDVLDNSGNADEMMKRFLREAPAAGALNHPNIITIYDADEQDGIAYIAMEYLEGKDLREIMGERRLDIAEAVEIAATICEALSAAHDGGIVHRDIKPANIMMPPNAPLKIADFGIAHMSDSTLTQDGALIGTPHYMSPEQFMGQKLDGRSDLFSVGVILYELLTGEKPYTGEALSTVMHHVIKTRPAPPEELNLSVSHPLSHVVMKAMDKRPADRYRDGRVMAAALRESLKENPDPAILGVPVAAPGKEDATIASAKAMDAPLRSQSHAPAGAARGSEISTVTGVRGPQGKSSADATVPGGVPPGAIEKTAPAGAASWARKKAYGIALGVVLAAGLLAGGLALLPGGATPRPGPGNGSANYYNRVSFMIYQAENEEVHRDWEDNQNLKRVIDHMSEPPAEVEVFDADKDVVVATQPDYRSGDLIYFDAAARPLRLSYKVMAGGQEIEKETMEEASQPEQLRPVITVVLPPPK